MGHFFLHVGIESQLAKGVAGHFFHQSQIEGMVGELVDQVFQEEDRLLIFSQGKACDSGHFVDLDFELLKVEDSVLPLEEVRFGQLLCELEHLAVIAPSQPLFHEKNNAFY